VRALKRTVRDLERLARHHAAAAERARLEARDAALEARLGGGAALLVPVAEWMLGLVSGLWFEGLRWLAAYVSFSSGASAM